MSDTNTKEISESRRKLLTETPIPELIIKLSIPTIISMLVTGIYNTADTYFVGKVSTAATAAVGLAFPAMAVIQASGFFCGHGSGNYLSRMLGAGNKKEANEMASTGFAVSIILGILIALLGNIFIYRIASWLGATPSTMKDTVTYMRIILLGAPFMMGQFVINNQLRFQGNAMYAMIGLMCGAFVNVFLDPLLIITFKMEVMGAAIATVSGQIMSFIVLLIGSSKGENIKLRFSDIHINLHYLKEITNGGAPSLFRQGMAAVSTLLLNNFAGHYGGEAAIAGMSITTRVMMMLASALIGFGQGYQPVCSYNFGAGLYKRVRDGFFFCLKWGTLFLICVSTLCFIFAPTVIGWFRNDPDVIAVGTVALRLQSATLPFLATTVMTNMMLQSMGRGFKASISSSARNGIFFIPLIIILPLIFGIKGVEATQAIADILSMAIAVPFAISEIRFLSKNDNAPLQKEV